MPNMHDLELYERPSIFSEGVIAGVTLRNRTLEQPAGVSYVQSAMFAADHARRQRERLAAAIGISSERLQLQRQVHGNEVREVCNIAPARESDGMICRLPGVVLGVAIADCAAILLYDPVRRAVAGLHSGWRGTKANIAAIGITKMQRLYGSHPGDLQAYVSACASGESYEVGWEVASAFPASVVTRGVRGKWLLDIRARIIQQLVEAGMNAQCIEVSEACTIRAERYHSYRRDGQGSGRMLAFIGLADDGGSGAASAEPNLL